MSDERTGTLFEDGGDKAGEGAGESAPTSHANSVRSAPEPASLPRPAMRTIRTPRRPAAPPPNSGPIFPWGAIPTRADSWAIARRDVRTQEYVELGHAEPGQRIEARIWPIDVLGDGSVIASRWGGGDYRIAWYSAKGNGGRRFISHSQPFGIRDEQPAPAPEAPRGPAPIEVFPADMQRSMLMMQALDGMAIGKLEQVARLGEVLRPQAQQVDVGAILTPIVEMMMRQQQSSDARFERMLSAMSQQRAGEDVEPNPAAAALGSVVEAAIDPDESFVDSLRRSFAKDPIATMSGLKDLASQLPQLAGMLREFMPKAPEPPKVEPPPPAPAPAPRRIATPAAKPPPATNGATNVVPIDGRALAQRETQKGPSTPPSS